MIYSVNTVDSLGDVKITANESYFGFGTINFVQECAEDELSIFEAAIKSDIREFGMIQESEDLTALNEGFVEQTKEKIKKMMQKFLEWIQSIMASVMKKFDTEVAKAATRYAKKAKEQFGKIKGELKFKGKALKYKPTDNFKSDLVVDSLKILENKIKGDVSEELLKEIKDTLEAVSKGTVKDFLDKATVEKDIKGNDVKKIFDDSISLLEKAKDEINPLRVLLKDAKTTATDLYKEAKKASKDAENKEAAARKVQAVAAYRDICTKILSLSMKLIRATLSTAKSTVGAIIRQNEKNDEKATGKDVEESALFIAMTENFDYIMEQSFDEISEGKDCECDDDEDIEDSDED